MAKETELKFRVVDKTHEYGSSTWYVGSSASGFNISAKILGGCWKLSFHPPEGGKDGHDSQFGATKTYREQLDSLSIPVPPLLRWTRGTTLDKAYVCAARILFPADHLRGRVSISPENQTHLIEGAPPSEAIEIFVTFSRAPLSPINGTILYSKYIKGFNEFVSLIFHKTDFVRSYLPEEGLYPVSPLDGWPVEKEGQGPVNALLYDMGTSEGQPQLRLIETSGLPFIKPGKSDKSEKG